jgi:hypothetical protein
VTELSSVNEVNFLSQVPSKDGAITRNQDLVHRTSMLFEHDILLIIYYNLLAIAVIGGIGVFLDLLRCFRAEKKKKRLDSNDREGTKNSRTDKGPSFEMLTICHRLPWHKSFNLK